MDLPRITRPQVVAALDALGLVEEHISSVQVTGTEVEVGVFVYDDEGSPLVVLGEVAQVYVTIPVEEV